MSLLKKNAECLATLVGVILYENLKGITETLGLGFAAVMFGVVLTVVGVAMTFMAQKGVKGTAVALAIHVALWFLKGVIGWLAGVAIACFIIYRLYGRPRTEGQRTETKDGSAGEMTFERLPARISAGTTTYYKTGSSSIGAQYVNERDPADVVSITTIYSSSSTEVSTNAGHFFFIL